MGHDPLQQFRGSDSERIGDDAGSVDRTLLVFEHGTASYAVPANVVDAVVAWQKPAPLPASVPALAGVVQDRGRIVAVLASPLGRPATDDVVPRRIVICKTERGFLGLPCTNTRYVGSVRFAREPMSGELIDSSSGPVLFTDPEVLAAELGEAV